MIFPVRDLLPAALLSLLRELMLGLRLGFGGFARSMVSAARLRGYAARSLSGLLVVALLLPGFAAAGEQMTVRVGVGSNPPIAFQDASGEMKGIAVDVLKEVAEKEGWRLEFVHAEWHELLDLLERGEIDLLTGIAYTPERAERFAFTKTTLLSNWGVVYARPDSKIQSLFDLQDKRVALVAGAIHSDELSKLVARFGVRIIPVAVEDYQQVLAIVARGDADAGVVSRVFGTLNSAGYDLESTGIVFSPISVRYAAPKNGDPAIVGSVDRHLGNLLAHRDSAYYASLDRWLGDVRTATLPDWVRWALIATASSLALAIIFVLSLRHQVRVRTLALRDSEESFRATFNQAAVGIAQVELDGRWREVNQRLCDIVGYSRAELLQRSFQDLTHPDDLHTDLEQVRQLLAGIKSTYALEKRYIHKSGAPVWIRLTVALVRGKDEAPRYFVSVIEDIADRKLADAALFDSEARSRLFIDHAPGALAMLDRELRYLAVSRRWLKDYGLEDCEVLGRSHYDIFPEITEAWKDVHRRGLAGEVVRADEERFVRYDGTVQWLRWEVRPWYAADGAAGGIVIFSEDISERKDAEAKARQGELVLDSVFQALPDLFFLIDPDGTIRDYRAQQSADLYVLPEAFLGRRLQDVFPAEIGEMVERKMGEIGERGALVTCEYDLTVSGATRRFEARLTRLPDQGQFIAVVRDITREYHDRLSLAGSEARYRRLFEHNPAPMLVYERTSLRLLAVNEAFTGHYGYSRDEALGMRLPDLYPEAEKQPLVDFEARLAGLVDVGEWQHLKKDGHLIHIEARSHDLLYEGQATRLAVITDITERKRGEKAVRDSERRLRLALEAARQGLYDLDLRTGEAETSPEYARMLGYQPEGFHETEASWRERLHPDDQASVLQRYQDYLAGRVADYRVEFRLRTRDGGWKWILSLGRIQERDAAGQPLRMLGTHTDIDAIKQAEANLREQEQFFRLIAENIGDMVTVLDRDGRRLYNSPAYRALFGEPAELQGSDAFASIHPDDRERVHRGFQMTIDTGVGQRGNFRVLLADGTVRHIESQGGVIRGVDGRVERVVMVSRDVTERKRLEDEIGQLNAELEQRVRQRTIELANANKELQTFTYSVSHDLKAPLRGIDGYSRLLLEEHHGQLNDEGRLFLDNVRHGVAQMSRLIEDLLAYSRMERRSLHSQTIDLSALVRTALDARRADIEARGLRVEAALPGLTAQADPEGVSMVLRNLVDNALKFTRDSRPPTLTIDAVATDKSIILAIRDNGIGFDMRFHDRIFNIFQRLQRAEDFPGTGVGLAIVHKAVQRMHGRVWAESAPGRGATFYVELPR